MTHLSQAFEFRCKFRQPSLAPGASLTVGDIFKLSMQLGLIEEEGNEFKEAVLAWADAPSEEAKAHTLKELADLVYVCYQMAVFLSVDLDTALDRVHASNMSKLDEDGNIVYNASGKVMKGPNYREPCLNDLV